MTAIISSLDSGSFPASRLRLGGGAHAFCLEFPPFSSVQALQVSLPGTLDRFL
jgi:hypothetical protein